MIAMRRHGAWAVGLLVGCGPALGSDTSFGEGDGGTAVADDGADSGEPTSGADGWNPVTDSGGTTGATGGADDTTAGPSATDDSDDSGDSGDCGDSGDSGGSDGPSGTTSAVEDSGGPVNAPDHAADCMLDVHIEPAIGQPELHVIGVYEASSDHSISAPASIHVDRPGEVFLAVLSYEQVTWTVTAGAGTTITQVTIGGYEASSANAPMGTMVVNQSSGGGLTYAYEWLDPDTAGIVATLEAQTGASLSSFAGCYQGTDFTID